MPFVWINGEFRDEADDVLTLRDAGLLHAAGVFTTMLARDGSVVLLDQHLRRLRTSCQTLGIPQAQSDAELKQAVTELLQRNDLGDARLRLSVTRGQSVR
ncbi:MAG: aminotransferase class IV, partial [Planctomycetota bacterium]